MNKETISPKDFCILHGCHTGAGPWCNRCGFNRQEDERRRQLPLVMGDDGILRKYVEGGTYEN